MTSDHLTPPIRDVDHEQLVTAEADILGGPRDHPHDPPELHQKFPR